MTPHQENTSPDDFTCKFCQTFKEQIILPKWSQYTEENF